MSRLDKYAKTILRKSRLVMVICFLLLFAGLATPTECFIQRDVYFNKSSYEPGDSGVFSVTIEGEVGVDPTLYFTRLEIFFDWENYWTSGVTIIDPGETKTISVTFSVPSSVSPGSHSYYYELTWSLSISLENPVTHTSSTSIITITEPAPEPTPDGGVFSWEFMVLMVAVGILVGILIGVVVTLVARKSKEETKSKGNVGIKHLKG